MNNDDSTAAGEGASEDVTDGVSSFNTPVSQSVHSTSEIKLETPCFDFIYYFSPQSNLTSAICIFKFNILSLKVWTQVSRQLKL